MPHFLIADDRQDKMQFMKDLVKLSRMDVEILEAETTEEAKKLIDEYDDIAYAFVDYQIPSECGPAIISHLKKKNPAARIALVTASAEAMFQQEASDAGAEATVSTSEPQAIERLENLLLEWKP